jgi:DNA-binding CsgD family transcriptional regulator
LKIGLEQRDTNITAHGYSVLSVVHNDRKAYKKALELNLKSLKLKEGKPDVSLIYNNLAVSYTGLGDYKNAIKYARLAIEGYKGDTVEVIGSMMNEVRALAMSGNISEAQNNMNQIENIIKQYGQHPDERYTHWLNYLISDGKKEYKQALNHFIKYHEMDSILTSEAHHLQFVQAETAYETKRKEQQNERLSAQVQLQKMIFGGIGLGLFLIGGLFFMQRNQLKIKNKLLETEQALATEKLQNAEQELINFTQSLKEKTDAFEKLKTEVVTQMASTERDNLLVYLTEASILTEEHWRDVRQKFERVYPTFFQQLQSVVPDATDAEKRLAALTKLNLTNNEIAAILGITPETVIKTRYRFRKKLEDGDLVGLLERI